MRFAIIDDHPLIFDALALVVGRVATQSSAEGFARLEEYESALEQGRRYDLVLLDLKLPGFDGLSALERFRSREDAESVVVLSASSDYATIMRALDLGAIGFIPKTSRRDVLIGALELVAAGGIYIPPEALRGDSSRPQDRPTLGYQAREQPAKRYSSHSTLTPRQREVLELLLRGLPNKLICRELSLSPNTVKSHISGIFRALDANNRTQAVIAAHQLGIRIDYERKISGASQFR
jgi:DNA-binding NarL/FixJ family response regulator